MGSRIISFSQWLICIISFFVFSLRDAQSGYIDTATCGANVWSVKSDVYSFPKTYSINGTALIKSIQGRSRIECSGFCTSTYDCVSVVYEEDTGECHLLSWAVDTSEGVVEYDNNQTLTVMNLKPVANNILRDGSPFRECTDLPCNDKGRCNVDCTNDEPICMGDGTDCADELPMSNIAFGSWTADYGADSGDILSLNYDKKHSHTGLKLYYSGCLRCCIWCAGCCTRWWFTIDGTECVSPGPIEFLEYHAQGRDHHRHGEFGGVCEFIPAGAHTIKVAVGACTGDSVRESYLGWNSRVFIRVEEVDLRPKTNLCPSLTVFNIKQHTARINSDDDQNAVLTTFSYTKRASDTALRVTWNGMLGQHSTGNMCNRWYFTFNGQECSDPDTISTVLAFISGSMDWGKRQYTLDGMCMGFAAGEITIEFRVSACQRDPRNLGNAYTGHWTGGYVPMARILVEETRLGLDINAVLKPDGRVVRLPVFNRQYWSWYQPRADTAATELKQFTYYKRSRTSGLRVYYSFVNRAMTNGKCGRWYFTFNGTECSSPGKIEHVIYQNHQSYGDTDWHVPAICDGTCYDLPMGTTTIRLMINTCNNVSPMSNSHTGWNTKQSLMVEETFLGT